ncbi:LGFP repeat-containing protein [Naasia aerilata]|uniref:LGFP repeat-containing protein n=1 Tax=Naasia aerilata TaxID=1162966 RepID=A0ABN6XLT0_9MICO|nr:hypothetical protein [Naasia aerilata]BDZ45884.1 hypothetical protein GCM10025866_17930 [Naasia aerilata]
MRRKSAIGRILLSLTAAAAVVAGVLTPGLAQTAEAADLSAFRAGSIISDGLMYNSGAMNEQQVQAFLNAKVPVCQSGYTCLKDYRENTPTIAADPMCGTYQGVAYESAATMIVKVARSCGINPQVLLVMLQKEQGLVADSWPASRQYRSAMGAGCPDTADCDVNYYGFFNQLHYGAYLLKRYTQPAGTGYGTSYSTRFDQMYPVRQTSAISYQANRPDCGTKSVYVENQATHSLYVYTPYTPNQAALNAGYGLGDGCSAYGNRNFFNYFSDWFGSTQVEVGTPFAAYYQANASWLGYPTSGYSCAAPGGCSQQFSGGAIVKATAGNVQGVRPGYLGAWSNYGREYDWLGYPTTDERCDMGGGACRQEFQGGWIVRSDRIGYRVVPTTERNAWGNWGREYGLVGLPLTDRWCNSSMCVQEFDGAWLVTSTAGGLRVVPNEVRPAWGNWGRETGMLGVPIGDPSVPGGATYQQAFAGGVISVTNGVGAVTSSTDPWWDTLIKSPWLGASTGPQSCTLKGGACYQPYTNGWVVKAPTGVFAVPTSVVKTWGAYGREYDILGFPTGAPSAVPTSGTYTQTFQGGTITATGANAAVTSSTDPWWNAILTSPWLGSATSGQSCSLKDGACYQAFAGGWVVKSKAGIYAVPSAVVSTWGSWGREYAILGFPTSAPSAAPSTGSYTQSFQGGVITFQNGGAALTSTTDPWWNTIVSTSWLGSSTGSQSCGLAGGGCYQPFANGWVVKSPAGIYAVPASVVQAWGWYGREQGNLGYPTGAPTADPSTGNFSQSFQGGSIAATNGSIGVTVANPWQDTIAASPWLGAATPGVNCTLKGGNCYQQFANGWVVKSPAGIYAVPAGVVQAWGWYGREFGSLGFPTGAPSASPATGTYTQTFQGGVFTVVNGAISIS